MSKITTRLNKKQFPEIVKRDKYQCPYCADTFTETNLPEWDWYNDDDADNRVENRTLAHHSCIEKKKDDIDLQLIANEKLKANERAIPVCERTRADTGSTDELTSSQKINKALHPIASQWLEEHLLMEQEILVKDAVNAIVHLCQEQIGWGSQPTIYRYIDEWTNPYNGQFTLVTKDGKTFIRKRTEN